MTTEPLLARSGYGRSDPAEEIAAILGSLFSLVLLALFIVFVVRIISKNNNSFSLVLQRFEVNPDNPDKLVAISGRNGGLVAWLLDLLKLSNCFDFTLSNSRVTLFAGSLFGELSTIAPRRRISIVQGGFSRPFVSLLLSLIFFSLALFSLFVTEETAAFLILGLIGALFAIHYSFGKRMTLKIFIGGTPFVHIRVRQGVIDGVPIDIQKVRNAVALISNAVANKLPKEPKVSPPPPPQD